MWDLTGMEVWGNYMGDIPVSGTVTLSRVKYGGEVTHHIRLKDGFDTKFGVSRQRGDTVIVEHKFIERVAS